MKRIFLAFVVLLLSGCLVPAAKTAPAPLDTETPGSPASAPSASPSKGIPGGKLPAASFESKTYINDTVGFALEYPAGWTVNESEIGPRGSQVQFLSSPDLANISVLPAGATRVSATVYQWDPKNDLAAFIDRQKTAWDSSGFMVLEEQALTLELGLAATRFTIRTPEADAIFLITGIGDRYLVLSGEGDLELVKEILQRVRPISSK